MENKKHYSLNNLKAKSKDIKSFDKKLNYILDKRSALVEKIINENNSIKQVELIHQVFKLGRSYETIN